VLSLSLAGWAALHRPTSTCVKSRSNRLRLSLSPFDGIPKNCDAFRIHTSKETNKVRWESRSKSGVTSFRLFSSPFDFGKSHDAFTTYSFAPFAVLFCVWPKMRTPYHRKRERESLCILNSVTFS
jgi:hypothetical protein